MKHALIALAFVCGAFPAFSQIVTETILIGTGFSVRAAADGHPLPSFEWFKDGSSIGTGSSYTIDAVELSHSGEYTVKATNSEGSAFSEAYVIKVEEAPQPLPPSGAPVFTLYPVSQEVPANVNAIFTVAAIGVEPITFQWFLHGVSIEPIPGATSPTFVAGPEYGSNTHLTVMATNTEGTATTGRVSLWRSAPVVIPPTDPVPSAPVFSKHPADTVIGLGFELRLEVAVSGEPVPTLQWEQDGVVIEGATENVYATIVNSTDDAGSYAVLAKSSSGVATSNPALVSVREEAPAGIPPVIIAAPSNMTVPKRASVRFEVTAEGEDLSYQWKKGTSNMVGETSPLLIVERVNPASGGTYTVTVSNPHGSVRTSAKLTVTR